MQRLRVGLVGAGLVGQAEHAFFLWEERDRFDFVALADASASVRAAVGARYGLKALHPGIDGLLTEVSRRGRHRRAGCLPPVDRDRRARCRAACDVREAARAHGRRLRPHRRGARPRQAASCRSPT